ncbi:MAG: ribosome silencing factor [Acidimicrobiales bacterium]
MTDLDACQAARAADDKLALDTVVIDVGDVLAITDHFVITSGSNVRQVRAIVEAVKEDLAANADRKALRTEGTDGYEWVLVDYGDFIVHVFLDTVREYYELERLWGDRPRVDWEP